jgi:hypothetical protein
LSSSSKRWQKPTAEHKKEKGILKEFLIEHVKSYEAQKRDPEFDAGNR